MTALVGKAIEEDEEFYQGVFGDEDADKEDYSAESSGKDSFDSDFIKSEKSASENEDAAEE
jgi:hypothetical protein